MSSGCAGSVYKVVFNSDNELISHTSSSLSEGVSSSYSSCDSSEEAHSEGSGWFSDVERSASLYKNNVAQKYESEFEGKEISDLESDATEPLSDESEFFSKPPLDETEWLPHRYLSPEDCSPTFQISGGICVPSFPEGKISLPADYSQVKRLCVKHLNTGPIFHQILQVVEKSLVLESLELTNVLTTVPQLNALVLLLSTKQTMRNLELSEHSLFALPHQLKKVARLIRNIPSLVKVTLRNNQISGVISSLALAKAFQNHPNLKHADLSGNPLKDRGVVLFVRNGGVDRLRSLSMRYCQITEESAQFLQNIVLDKNACGTHPCELDLTGNYIVSKGGMDSFVKEGASRYVFNEHLEGSSTEEQSLREDRPTSSSVRKPLVRSNAMIHSALSINSVHSTADIAPSLDDISPSSDEVNDTPNTSKGLRIKRRAPIRSAPSSFAASAKASSDGDRRLPKSKVKRQRVIS
jgi:hypothetical protein